MPHYQLPDQCKNARHLSNNGSYPQYKTPPADIYIGKPATVLQPDQTGKGPGQVLFEIKKYKHPSRPAPCTSAPISINIQHNQRWFFLKQPLMKHRPQASQGGMRAPGPTKEHEPLSKLTGNDHAKAFAPIQNS